MPNSDRTVPITSSQKLVVEAERNGPNGRAGRIGKNGRMAASPDVDMPVRSFGLGTYQACYLQRDFRLRTLACPADVHHVASRHVSPILIDPCRGHALDSMILKATERPLSGTPSSGSPGSPGKALSPGHAASLLYRKVTGPHSFDPR